MVIEFADGRTCVFEARDPGPGDIGIEHAPSSRILDQYQPAYPELIDDLAALGAVTGVVLRIRAARGQALRYLKAEP